MDPHGAEGHDARLKNKSGKSGMFFGPEKHHTKHHDSPRIHHNFTTIYHHKTLQNPQNPL
jgi:hypothetical protein